MIKATPTGVEIRIRVLPRARRTEMAGTRGEALLVRLAAPVEWLSRCLDVPAGAVQILSGQHSRNKRVAVAGATVEGLRRSLKL